MKKTLFLITILFFITNFSYAGNDGSSIEKAIVLKNIGNYEICKTTEDIFRVVDKDTTRWIDYVNKRFGKRGEDWELRGLHKFDKDDKQFYSAEIMLLSSEKIIILYFDVTEPYKLWYKELAKYSQRVPNETVAINIAEEVLKGIYGKKVIKGEKPLKAKLKDDFWIVEGTLHCPKGQKCKSGAVNVEISQKDRRIIKVILGNTKVMEQFK